MSPDSRPEADLTDIGVEIKSIPIGGRRDLRPHEHTKITMLNFQDVAENEFENSRVYHKLRNILFVPIVKNDKDKPDEWYIRSPFIWMPSLDALKQLKTDYDAVRALIMEGRIDEVSGARPPKGQGEHLLPNTAGRDSSDTMTYEVNGRTVEGKRRAWMLRKDFTEVVLRENVSYLVL